MTAVELAGITKRFPGVVANHDIHLTVRKGTVHALVGENGAGKSTLMKILYGMQKPDEGTIAVDGEKVAFSSPADAIVRGIGMVHQHFMLADNLTVLENVVLGSEKLYGIGAKARRKIKELSDRYGLGVRPDVLVEELGVAARQRVEILKVLYRGARTLILDEPTAVLVPQEVDALFDNLRELKAEGLSVIFISHKLGEVLSVADEITVIRRGTARSSPSTRCAWPRPAARPCSTTSPSPSTPVRSSASPASRATARPSWSTRSSACATPTPAPSASSTRTSPRCPPASAASRASATSPRTGTATGCSWRPPSGRTASSATSPRSPTARASGWT